MILRLHIALTHAEIKLITSLRGVINNATATGLYPQCHGLIHSVTWFKRALP